MFCHRTMEWRAIGTVSALAIFGLCLLTFSVLTLRPKLEDPSHEDARLFEDYVDRYNKPYRNDPTEYQQRFERFKRSLRHIEMMNGLRSSQESAYYGLTQFSDMSEDEFLTETLQRDLSDRGQKHLNASYYRWHSKYVRNRARRAAIPSKFDWREKGVVTPVRSQGACGACWAFSTIEVAESMFAIKNGTLVSFSVQEMIDCARNNNFGCEGGDICSLLKWLVMFKVKIVPASEYPLTLTTGTCKFRKNLSEAQGIMVTGFTCDSFVEAEDELLAVIANHGPVAAAVNALSWQNYLGGVIQYHCDGSFSNLNHAVEIIGYDNSAKIPHYIIKNSWGPSFGDKGYMYIGIGSNLCGIANQVSSLDVK